MNFSTKEFASKGGNPFYCNYGPCRCLVQSKDVYCSEYCRQAAAQGVERDYCQCEHEHGVKAFAAAAVHTMHLSGQHQFIADDVRSM
jgi:hypothetical protein